MPAMLKRERGTQGSKAFYTRPLENRMSMRTCRFPLRVNQKRFFLPYVLFIKPHPFNKMAAPRIPAWHHVGTARRPPSAVFIAGCKEHGIDPSTCCLPHGSYLVNLAHREPDGKMDDNEFLSRYGIIDQGADGNKRIKMYTEDGRDFKSACMLWFPLSWSTFGPVLRDFRQLAIGRARAEIKHVYQCWIFWTVCWRLKSEDPKIPVKTGTCPEHLDVLKRGKATTLCGKEKGKPAVWRTCLRRNNFAHMNDGCSLQATIAGVVFSKCKGLAAMSCTTCT
ncbi:hypothetical protein FB567DRAFT_1872 [Paraphoma chrysanthemicola]|uniref:Uncharacterized protein n=1 Tax=Paraphoma chrysanthemicola TaxID=798071 RepID=A0A8K0RG16_9PLEO|nr:hypothetical protein FB567DRAFT_1872 [Paraphoma chrysanthemicola]